MSLSVSNVFCNRLAKITEVKSKLSSAFRENLKSTGQSKYALDEKEEGVCGRHNILIICYFDRLLFECSIV